MEAQLKVGKIRNSITLILNQYFLAYLSYRSLDWLESCLKCSGAFIQSGKITHALIFRNCGLFLGKIFQNLVFFFNYQLLKLRNFWKNHISMIESERKYIVIISLPTRNICGEFWSLSGDCTSIAWIPKAADRRWCSHLCQKSWAQLSRGAEDHEGAW